MRIETAAVHAARTIDPQTGAVAPPIHLSTTFERDADGGHSRGFSYARTDNPARRTLENLLAQLEGGRRAVAFASGLTASSAILQSLAPGDHVVFPREIYHGVRSMAEQIFAPWGLGFSAVHMHEPGALESAMSDRTRLVWIETPANPMLQITDIRAAAEIAHAAGALIACDNTFATPILQRPIDFGVDLSVHSTTKWIGGHSDLTGGVVVCREDDATAERLRTIQRLGGGVPGPFDCWLAARGARSLGCRICAASQTALSLAKTLEDHPSIKQVLYPGLESHEQHRLAATQMSSFGGIVSIRVGDGGARAMEVASRMKLFTRATSLGGVESLVEHRASIEGPDSTTPGDLLRLSIGLEHPDDLLEDLDQALRGA